MPKRIIEAYWKVIGTVNESLPPQRDVVQFAFHLGRATNEVKKGFRSLKKKEIKPKQPKRIGIE